MHKTSIPSRHVSPSACMFVNSIAVERGTRCEDHGHSCTELVFTGASRGILHDGGRRWNYQPQTVFGYQPGTTHWVQTTGSGTHLCLGIRGGGAELLDVGPMPSTPVAIERFHQIEAATRTASSSRQARLNLLVGLLILDLLDAAQVVPSSPASLFDGETKAADLARKLIDERFKRPLLISDVAESVYISPEHLRRVFKDTFGTSPMHYLIRRRIDHACELLVSSDTPIHEVGTASGIDDPYYFSRLFKRVTGQTPTAYRAMKKR